jgi:septum site-determining protein MinC
MAVVSPASTTPAAFELKSASLSLVAVVLKTTDLALLSQALDQRFADAPGLFDQDPVAIDLSLVRDSTEVIDFVALVDLLRGHKMLPVAAKSGSALQMEAALAAGLSEAHGPAAAAQPVRSVTPQDLPATPAPPVGSDALNLALMVASVLTARTMSLAVVLPASILKVSVLAWASNTAVSFPCVIAPSS